MERIGIAASKIAKGVLWVYNLYVILISFMIAFFVFLIAGCSIFLSLIIVGYVVNGVLPQDAGQDWIGVIKTCMVALTVVISLFMSVSLFKNIRIDKKSFSRRRTLKNE